MVEVRRLLDCGLVRLLLALRREEAMHVAPVPKHFQGVLGLTIGRLQHQQHDAKIEFHIARVEPVALFQNAHAACRRPVEHLPVGMLAIGKLFQGLAVDRFVRNDPENEAGITVEIAPEDEPELDEDLADPTTEVAAEVGD